jgi:hypothetical protein
MGAVELGVDLRERLGAEGSSELVEAFKVAQNDMLTMATERFEARLTSVAAELRGEMASLKSDLRQEIAAGDTALRVALVEGLSHIRREMSDMRVDVLRWSFVFWLGQVAATATMLAVLLRALGR